MTATGRRGVAGAALATLIAFSMLIGLGVWQLHRLAWKQGLLQQIAQAEQAPPVALGDTTPPLFARVIAHGALRPGIAALYGAEVRGDGNAARMGAQLVGVLDRPGLRPLLVVLGWVPTDHGAVLPPLGGSAAVTGYVRLPEASGFLSAADDVAGRHFYALNPAVIGPALGAANAAPFTLVALGPAEPGRPVPAESLPRPVNNHLNYALTWFGLAAALLGVFVVWVRRLG